MGIFDFFKRKEPQVTTSVVEQSRAEQPQEKKLTYVEKELIMVNRITAQDMLQFDMLPYSFDCLIKKHIKEGSHPYAYIELNKQNQEIAKSDLSRINQYIVQAIDYIPKLTHAYEIQVDKIVFQRYSQSGGYGYTIIVCTPYTFAGKISTHPFSLSFSSRQDVQDYTVHGELFYGRDGSIMKGSVNVWRRQNGYEKPATGWLFSFKTIGHTLVLNQAKSTLFADKRGMPGIAYEVD